MKLLWMENRYTTRLYAEVAARLQTDGHEIHWIVQNPIFTPAVGNAHIIPFPEALSSSPVPDEEQTLFDRIAVSDRQIQYFGGDSRHYAHYFRRLQALIDSLQPDVAFGESTQFLELLTIECCRRRRIPYLNPISIGYPQGRICFLSYDSRTPVGGDGSEPTLSKAVQQLATINRGDVPPDYMLVPPMGRVGRLYLRLVDWARITRGWLMGERFSTPSPLRKAARELTRLKARHQWNAVAGVRSLSGRPYVLYAMHVQPECSIDVWGLPWNDQIEIVRRAAAALAVDGIDLVVKPHPSSKYEITAGLCDLVASTSNIVAIPANVPMREVFPAAVAILSVTGTILLEAVFAGKPAIAVGMQAMAAYPGIVRIEAPEEVSGALRRAREAGTGEREQAAVRMLQWLHRVSYNGEIPEPLFSSHKMTPSHLQRLYAAFSHVIAGLRVTARRS